MMWKSVVFRSSQQIPARVRTVVSNPHSTTGRHERRLSSWGATPPLYHGSLVGRAGVRGGRAAAVAGHEAATEVARALLGGGGERAKVDHQPLGLLVGHLPAVEGLPLGEGDDRGVE